MLSCEMIDSEDDELGPELERIDASGDNLESENSESGWKDDDFLSFQINTSAANIDDADENEGSPAKIVASDVTLSPLPPWMKSHHVNTRSYRLIPLIALHNEIVDFAALMTPQEYEAKERERLTDSVKKLIKETFGEDKCSVVVFGSQATGLFLPTSDIDIVVYLAKNEGKEDNGKADENLINYNAAKLVEQQEMAAWDSAFVLSPLYRLSNALRNEWTEDLSYLEVVENTRIPIVKFTHAPTKLSIDVCFDQTSGPQAAELVKRFMDAMPPLKPLTFVLKYFMAARGLNEPYSGGIGSFMLQMMIVSFLQHREREQFNNNRCSAISLGALLLEFFELYGMDFNYVTTGISVRSDGSYFPKGAKDRKEFFWQPTRPYSLAMENPLEPNVDVGRSSFRMQLIQRSFEVAFRVLMAHVCEPVLPAVSILASILPPTEEMQNRAILLKTHRA